MSDKQGTPTSASRKRKRIKLKCLVAGCNQTFDDDYRANHNRKYHKDLLTRSSSIPYDVVGAPKNPFSMSKSSQQKQRETSSSSTSEAAVMPAVGS